MQDIFSFIGVYQINKLILLYWLPGSNAIHLLERTRTSSIGTLLTSKMFIATIAGSGRISEETLVGGKVYGAVEGGEGGEFVDLGIDGGHEGGKLGKGGRLVALHEAELDSIGAVNAGGNESADGVSGKSAVDEGDVSYASRLEDVVDVGEVVQVDEMLGDVDGWGRRLGDNGKDGAGIDDAIEVESEGGKAANIKGKGLWSCVRVNKGLANDEVKHGGGVDRKRVGAIKWDVSSGQPCLGALGGDDACIKLCL